MYQKRRESISTNKMKSEVKEDSSRPKEKTRYDEIPIKDKILLGPIDKYRKYNRFPWKYLFHIVVVVMTTF